MPIIALIGLAIPDTIARCLEAGRLAICMCQVDCLSWSRSSLRMCGAALKQIVVERMPIVTSKEYMMEHAPHIQPIEILVVDDNPGDVQLIIEAFQDAKLSPQLHAVGDGVTALAFLRREGPYQGEPRPDLIILDLNIPKKDGHTVLREIKADPTLRQIPVVVLSTSRADDDIHRVYDLHANCFITKPVDFAQFVTIAQAIDHFWFATVTLPPQRPSRS